MPVAVTNYTDLATLTSYLSVQSGTADLMLTLAITAASRAIDRYCQRRFWQDPTPVARTFIPNNLTYLRLPVGHDIASAAGLQIACDPSGVGVYSIVWAAGDYELLPNNAPTMAPEPMPWTALRAVGTKTFPWLVNTWLTRLDRVQITALWGWPQIPADVSQACLIKAARLYHRKYAPQGIVGAGDFGPIRLSRGEDTDVISLLSGYIAAPVLVG